MLLDIGEYDDFPTPRGIGDAFYHRQENKIYVWKGDGWVNVTALYPGRLPNNYVSRDALTRVTYLGRDWQTILNELKARLIEKFPDYEDFFNTDMGMVLLDVIAYGFDGLAWYQDKWASELFFDTVATRKNLVRLARFLGYCPGGVTPARVKLDFQIVPQAFPVIIPKGFKVGTPDIIFETITDITIPAGQSRPDSSQNTDAVEGETRFVNTTATDSDWQTVKLPVPDGKKLAWRSVKVRVGSQEWQETDFWNYADQAEFVVRYDEDPPYVMFGDGVVAKKPPEGASINVEYRVSVGSKGNVAQNTITRVISPLMVRGVNVNLAVNNPRRATGGADEEPAEQIKYLAPRYFQTQDRCVSWEDYETLILNFKSTLGAVAKVKAVVEFGIDDDAYLMGLLNELRRLEVVPGANEPSEGVINSLYLRLKGYLDGYFNGRKNVNVVSFYLLSRDENGQYTAPPPEFVSEDETVNPLLAYLNERKVGTVKIKLLDGSIYLRNARVAVEARILPGYWSNEVVSAIEQAVRKHFAKLDFGDAVRLSDVYAVIEAVPGVDYCRVQLLKGTTQNEGIEEVAGDLEVPKYLLLVLESITIETI